MQKFNRWKTALIFITLYERRQRHGSSFFRISPQALDHPVLDRPLADRSSLIRNHIFLVGPADTLRALCEQIVLPDFWSAIAFLFRADQHWILSGVFSGAFHRISGVSFSHRGRILRATGAAHEDGSRRFLRDPGADLDRL